MGLRLITGRSGQGKTEGMLREIVREACLHPEKKYFLVVPEQFSLEMQRRMVELHPRKGFFNIDILSFHRLAYRIFDETGHEPAKLLEDLGVAMILRRILSRKEEELDYFKKSARKAGFVDEVKSALMELISYGVSWEELETIAGDLDDRPVLQRKCRELAMIFSCFLKETSGRFMVTEQILTLAADYVRQCGLVRDGEFYFDGFTGFTPVQLDFLGELLDSAGNVHITVTIPAGKDPDLLIKESRKEDLFHFSRKFISSLTDLCAKRKADLLPVTGFQDKSGPRFGDRKDLLFLEENVFRVRKKVYMEAPAHIHLTACRRQDEEADYILRQVEYLVRKRGIRYRDCAVLCGNVEEYEPEFRRKAELLRIPLFVDSKRKISYHCGVEALRALFHLAEMNYSYESVFRYLKTGMSCLKDDEVDFLENYVISAGVRGYGMWSEPFKRRLAGKSPETVDRLEELRKRFMAETEDFVVSCRQRTASVRVRMKALYEAMDRLDFPARLEGLAQEAEKRGDHVLAGEHRRLYELLLTLLDKIVMIFGEEVFSLKEVSEILDAGLESLGLGVAPLTMDQLILGDLKRTRLAEVKVLFIAGMNDGKIPPVLEDGGLLNDEDKDLLRQHGISLSSGLLERSVEDEFYMYLAFSKPAEDLYFSYSAAGRGADRLRPSPLLARIRDIFPELKESTYPSGRGRYYFGLDDSRQLLIEGLGRIRRRQPAWMRQLAETAVAQSEERCGEGNSRENMAETAVAQSEERCGEENSRENMAETAVAQSEQKDREEESREGRIEAVKTDNIEIGREDRIFLMLAGYWSKEPACRKEYLTYLSRLQPVDRVKTVDPVLMEALYGKELYGSVSQLESFSTCPFSYFCSYGLNLREREEFALQAADFGTLFHAALQYFSDQVKESPYRWKDIPEDERTDFLAQSMNRALEENRVEAFSGSARDAYQVRRVKRILDRTVRAIQLQLKHSDFEPDRFELHFGHRGKDSMSSYRLEDGRQIHLSGSIDRVDLCVEDEDVLIRIVDYKSGDRDLNLSDAYHGLQLQLLLYLDAATAIYEEKTGKEVIPGGIFYYRFQDPFYRGDRFEEGKYWQQFRMKGYANSSKEILEKLEDGSEGFFSMALQRKKDGNFKSGAHVMTSEEFRDMRRHIVNTAKSLAGKIYSGEIFPNPYRKKNKTEGCQYCRYNSVCGFGTGLYKDYYRQLREFSAEEVLQMIQEEKA